MQHKYAIDAKARAEGTGESLVLSNPVTILYMNCLTRNGIQC